MTAPQLDLVVGARPNFIKLAPVARALAARGLRTRTVHTGQHTGDAMSRVFFEQLDIPDPDVHLSVGPGRHGARTAEMLIRYEETLVALPPQGVVVFGDVDSTLACALAAAKLSIPVAHVEAGLRSFDRTMPEEINRVATDAISDLWLVTEPSGVAQLERDGHPPDRIHLVGNTMIDTLLRLAPQAREMSRAQALGLAERGYLVLTLHRPSNVDDATVLEGLLGAIATVAERVPIVFPVHPRTRASLDRAGLELGPNVHALEPEGYVEMLSLTLGAQGVLTDSGGLQQEAAALRVPCITLRDRTEHHVTIETGANRAVGNDPEQVLAAADDLLEGRWGDITEVPLWDGRAGERIAERLEAWLAAQ